jgi:N-acetylmuramate 1-kinase
MTLILNRPGDGLLPEPINLFLDRTGLREAQARVVPLTGDASDRRYFRVIHRSGQTVVLALHAAPFAYDRLPFVNVAGLLAQMPLPIPAILDHADDLGLLVLEDLGDVTLQAHLGAAPPTEHAALYREAVGLIHALQGRGEELASPAFVPYSIAFDVEKLTWELEFFVKHFMLAYRGVTIEPAAREALSQEWRSIVDELAAEPRVLCHRDYHSRNLMLHQSRLFIIDFQDARMGPDTYDLVSLLRDSYVDIGEAEVEELIAFFLALKGRSGVKSLSSNEADGNGLAFRRRFDLMALQRNLKALGTFGYQTATRGNPVYIQYIPRTLRYVRTNLHRHARFGRLHQLLASQLEELR